jgi:hypothetical protein
MKEASTMKVKKYLDIRLPHLRIPLWWPNLPADWRAWLPSRGNVLFTLLVVGALLWAASAGALPLRAPAAAGTSTGTIAYQGRLADANGSPLTGTYNMIFRLYEAASSGAPLWTEQWTGSNGVKVSDGLFNVMLGSLTPIPTSLVTDHASLFLGITVGSDDEMTPRVQLGSVPFAVQALTVPDGSVTTAKIADGAVTSAKMNVTSGLNMTGDLVVNGLTRTTKIVSTNSTKSNSDLTAGNMGKNTWTITTAGSPLEHWNVEETWMYFGGNLYFVQWTLGIQNAYESNHIDVPANSNTAISLATWNTQEFASSRFANMEGRSYLTGVSSVTNLINLTNWPSNPTLVDFAVYNGLGGVNGAAFGFSNPSSNDAIVRSFSIQGFVYTP